MMQNTVLWQVKMFIQNVEEWQKVNFGPFMRVYHTHRERAYGRGAWGGFHYQHIRIHFQRNKATVFLILLQKHVTYKNIL